MEPQQQQNELTADGGKTGRGFLCRQSSARWTPTNDQIRILKDLYYNNGVRSPTAEQFQRISARLRQYGKMEGKNVFYWFQNHKAREKQNKRFTVDHNNNNILMQKGHVWRSDYECPIYNKYPNIITTPGVPSTSNSSGVAVVGQMESYGYGSIAMEKSFQDCSISPGGGCGGGPMGHNFGWPAVDPYHPSPYPFLDQKRMPVEETLVEGEEAEEEEEEEEEPKPDLETLHLFPMHGEDISGRFCRPESNGYYSGWYNPEDITGASRASLELSLYSYAGRSTDFP